MKTHANSPNMRAGSLRTAILVLLVGQTVLIVILMHYSRTVPRAASDGPMYKSSVAVFLAEAFKLPLCFFMIGYETRDVGPLHRVLYLEMFGANILDTLKCSVPALCYTIQNNLLFVAITNLDPPTYQVCYQMKTLTTAGFSYLLLSRRLSLSQWAAVALLVAGASPRV